MTSACPGFLGSGSASTQIVNPAFLRSLFRVTYCAVSVFSRLCSKVACPFQIEFGWDSRRMAFRSRILSCSSAMHSRFTDIASPLKKSMDSSPSSTCAEVMPRMKRSSSPQIGLLMRGLFEKTCSSQSITHLRFHKDGFFVAFGFKYFEPIVLHENGNSAFGFGLPS